MTRKEAAIWQLYFPSDMSATRKKKLRILDPMHSSKSKETPSSTYSMKQARTTAPTQLNLKTSKAKQADKKQDRIHR